MTVGVSAAIDVGNVDLSRDGVYLVFIPDTLEKLTIVLKLVRCCRADCRDAKVRGDGTRM